MLVAYSFQIYFDFAGYSDIAIGTGMLLGFQLPENFNHPYRQPNLTLFWNNWHMTLTQWIRGYLFNPLTPLPAQEQETARPAHHLHYANDDHARDRAMARRHAQFHHLGCLARTGLIHSQPLEQLRRSEGQKPDG